MWYNRFELNLYSKAMEKFNLINKAEEVTQKPLEQTVAEIAQIQNERYGNIFNTDSLINMKEFSDLFGEEAVRQDEEKVEKQELEFSDANTTNPSRLAFFEEKGLNTPEKRLEHWREKERTEPEKLEKAILCIFHKFLHSKFIIARASKYDDYFNGVDTVIVDAQTQKVVGAFDEVRGTDSLLGNTKKLEKVFNKAQKGGANLKYGLNFEKDSEKDSTQKITKKEIYHVPLFVIALNKEDLSDLLKGMNGEAEGKPAEIESKIFNQILDSFENQIKIFEDPRSEIKGYVAENIESFKGTLQRMRKLGDDLKPNAN
jgi:hypothetical protein